MTKRIEYHSNSDKLGRCHFSLWWPVDYIPGHPAGENAPRERGQNFYADPKQYGFARPEDN